MNTKRILQTLAMSAVTAIWMTATASAVTITYNTNAPGTGFGGTSLVLNNTSGQAATLTFAPNANTITGVPSNVNLGIFTLICSTCTTQQLGAGSVFGAFSLDLIVTDVSDGATGKFVGTSTGGSIFSDVSQITVNWAPLTLGPGVSNATSGNFGPTVFTTTIFTGIVAPNSGTVPGQSTVQGTVNSSDVTGVPEPMTLSLVGAALLGIRLLSSKRQTRQ